MGEILFRGSCDQALSWFNDNIEKNDIEKLLSHAGGALRRTERIAMINLAASALTLVAAGMIILGLLR